MQAKPFALIDTRRLGGYATHSENITGPRPKTTPLIKLCAALAACALLSTAATAQGRPGAAVADQKPGYVVDGRMLGSKLTSDSAARDYKCGPSEQFAGFTWCQK